MSVSCGDSVLGLLINRPCAVGSGVSARRPYGFARLLGRDTWQHCGLGSCAQQMWTSAGHRIYQQTCIAGMFDNDDIVLRSCFLELDGIGENEIL